MPDATPDTGPMGALAQLAPRLRDGAWIVVPVDMPLLSDALLAALRARAAWTALTAPGGLGDFRWSFEQVAPVTSSDAAS